MATDKSATVTPAPVTDHDRDDVMALSGLRRLVLHARDRLEATKIRFTTEPEFPYNEHLRPDDIRRSAAMVLATEVLTLVADCLPGDAPISADEAAERQRKHEQEVARLRERLDKVSKDAASAIEEARTARKEHEAAVDLQLAAEDEAINWSEQWRRLTELAQTSVPDAVRYLLSGGTDDPAVRADDGDESQAAADNEVGVS